MRGTLKGIVGFRRALGAAALMTAVLAPAVFAQTPAPVRPQTQGGQAQTRKAGADAEADLSITARVTAESLRFEKVPNPRVEFTGRPERSTAWESDRENLPQEVRPGVTYRNIGITLRITSVFADIDRIVAEALGEVSPGEDARPTTPQPPASDTRQPATNTPPPVTSSPPSTTSTPPPDSTIPPAQPSTSAATTRPSRRAHARRGRVN